MKYFDKIGRCIPSQGMRVFGGKFGNYYVITNPEINYARILQNCKDFNGVSPDYALDEFEEKAELLLDVIKTDSNYSNLLNGVHIPFIYERVGLVGDLGGHLENTLLPNLKIAFNELYPTNHFKAILQGDSKLQGHISVYPDSGHEKFIDATSKRPIVGWYFPQALQEYDIRSQRLQMRALPELKGAEVCLSGAIDVCSALIGHPGLLISDEHYAPILCLSAYVHQDPRLVLLIKAHGPHMEFWCMTQMLTKEVIQVSEQWSGGLTIF